MKIITPDDYRRMPWKNGGGITTEIFRSPAEGEVFDWRISIADVAEDGPFSLFPGYDRHIMTIAGGGMMLFGATEQPLDVTTPNRPVSFSGDWQLTAKLASGPCRDFNLMARRDRIESSLNAIGFSGHLPIHRDQSEIHILHALEGDVLIDGTRLPAGCSAILDQMITAGTYSLAPAEPGQSPLLVLARLKKR